MTKRKAPGPWWDDKHPNCYYKVHRTRIPSLKDIVGRSLRRAEFLVAALASPARGSLSRCEMNYIMALIRQAPSADVIESLVASVEIDGVERTFSDNDVTPGSGRMGDYYLG